MCLDVYFYKKKFEILKEKIYIITFVIKYPIQEKCLTVLLLRLTVLLLRLTVLLLRLTVVYHHHHHHHHHHHQITHRFLHQMCLTTV